MDCLRMGRMIRPYGRNGRYKGGVRRKGPWTLIPLYDYVLLLSLNEETDRNDLNLESLACRGWASWYRFERIFVIYPF